MESDKDIVSENNKELRWFDLLPKKNSDNSTAISADTSRNINSDAIPANHLVHGALEDLSNYAPIRDILLKRKITLSYSGHFKSYNSNARYTKDHIQLNLSVKWKAVDGDIQQGLIESFLVKVLRLKIEKTSSMKLYEDFMKGLSIYAKKHTRDPLLEESFNRVNERFFSNMMDKPNLIFAGASFSKLGSYEYTTDTVYVSEIFCDLSDDELMFLDYVLYHELLHKKHSFNIKNGRHHAHTHKFRIDEQKFGKNIEAALSGFLRRKKRLSNHSGRRIGNNSSSGSRLRNIFKWW